MCQIFCCGITKVCVCIWLFTMNKIAPMPCYSTLWAFLGSICLEFAVRFSLHVLCVVLGSIYLKVTVPFPYRLIYHTVFRVWLLVEFRPPVT